MDNNQELLPTRHDPYYIINIQAELLSTLV